MLELFCERRLVLLSSLRMSDDDYIISVRNRYELSPDCLPYAALDAISHHGVSNLLAHRQRNSTRSIRLGCVHHQDAGQTDSTALARTR